MDNIGDLVNSESTDFLISLLVFIGAVAVVILIYRYVIKKLKKRAAHTSSQIDNFIYDMLKMPFLFLLLWIMLKIYTKTSFFDTKYQNLIDHSMEILLIVTIEWIVINGIKILFFYLEKKVGAKSHNSFEVQGNMTRFSIFERIIISLIVVVTVAICLLTFDKIRTVGISILTSAGILTAVAGLAAQKSLSSIMAGLQIAITQPIKLNDVVVIEGQNGRVEEINTTYVVVKIWDKRRLILPINYFLDNPIENWTRNSSDLLAAVYLYVDFNMPIEPLRDHLKKIIENNPLWDKTLANINVNNMKDYGMELRILFSSPDSGKSSDLQFYIREEMIKFIQQNYP
ncbi:MAG: mechanosensitive ion channel family protein [Rikenellaceae bacterium]|nr:mechanosensitive ion channel family protein [Rikenellaceae bacterium]